MVPFSLNLYYISTWFNIYSPSTAVHFSKLFNRALVRRQIWGGSEKFSFQAALSCLVHPQLSLRFKAWSDIPGGNLFPFLPQTFCFSKLKRCWCNVDSKSVIHSPLKKNPWVFDRNIFCRSTFLISKYLHPTSSGINPKSKSEKNIVR